MDKVVVTSADAVAGVTDGAWVAVGGFGLTGIPDALLGAPLHSGVGRLSTVSNNCGADGRAWACCSRRA